MEFRRAWGNCAASPPNEAVEIARKADRPQVLARALAALGDVLREQGKLVEADQVKRELLMPARGTNAPAQLERQ